MISSDIDIERRSRPSAEDKREARSLSAAVEPHTLDPA